MDTKKISSRKKFPIFKPCFGSQSAKTGMFAVPKLRVPVFINRFEDRAVPPGREKTY
jgi:hypothetical protein